VTVIAVVWVVETRGDVFGLDETGDREELVVEVVVD